LGRPVQKCAPGDSSQGEGGRDAHGSRGSDRQGAGAPDQGEDGGHLMACKILILAEQEEGTVRETTFELLGLAHRLSGEAGWPVSEIKVVVIGQGVGDMAKSVAGRGAFEVICAEGDAVKDYSCDGQARVLESVIRAESPEMVLVGHTPNGWETAPMVAAGLGV